MNALIYIVGTLTSLYLAVLMLRLMSDLLPALIAARDGVLKSFDLRWYPEVALTVVMAANG